MRPFIRVLEDVLPKELLSPFLELDPDTRLTIDATHRMLEFAVGATGDPDIGLKAVRAVVRGDAGVLDYAIGSADTVRDAMETAVRYKRLVSDVGECRFEIDGTRAVLEVDNRHPQPRAAEDFEIGGLFVSFAAVWKAGAGATLRVSFAFPAPERTVEYERTFGNVPVVFGAPFSGFDFDVRCLDSKLETRDSALHDVLRQHAERTLGELPRAEALTERVRRALAAELAGGTPTVAHLAPRLHMSERTLERKLESEGTTFSGILADLRKGLALRYVGTRDVDLSEVAFLLGFSQSSAFHRAFKRWTGETPLAYRRAQREAKVTITVPEATLGTTDSGVDRDSS
jgi:AraC-like DNA-binding protein